MSGPQRSALVTGAASGIGRAIATRLLDDDHRVLAVDADTDGLARLRVDLGSPALSTEVLDVSDLSAVERFGADRLAVWGALDVVVNNAGFGFEKPFYDTTAAEWQRLVDVDLSGVFHVTRAAWPHLRKPGGSIVNVSSVHADRPLPGHAAYGAAKGGVNTLTKAMALDSAPFGVRANAIMPGFVRTAVWDRWVASQTDVRTVEDFVTATVPAGRPGEASEIAALAVWLASPAASYVSGAVVEADGGLLSRAYPPFSVEGDGR